LQDYALREVTETVKEAVSRGILGDSYILSLFKAETRAADRAYYPFYTGGVIKIPGAAKAVK